MNRRVIALIALVVLAFSATLYCLLSLRPRALTLTGLVTTNDVIVSAQIPGQVDRLLVVEGDSVKRDQLLAVIKPDELRAETDYYAQSAEQSAAEVQESEAALRYQEKVTADQIKQAQASYASAEAQRAAAAADAENARL